MTTLNKGDMEAGTGILNQFGILPAGADNNVVIYDSTQPTGLNTANVNSLITVATTQQIYVSLQGSDITGNGTAINPYATITFAMSTYSDQSPTKRYVIFVQPGFYPENIHLKANTFIVATSPVETRLTGNIDINDASWNVPGADNRSGLRSIEHRTGTSIFDFTAQAGNDSGKLYFFDVRFSDQPAITGLSTSQINQVTFHGCYLFSGVKNTGCITQVANSYNAGGTYENHSSAAASTTSDFQIVGGGNDGNYLNAWTSNSAITMEIEGVGFGTGTTLSTTGASATTTVNRASLPDNTKITTTAGTLNVYGGMNAGVSRSYVARGGAAFSTSYTPSTTNDAFVNVIFSFTNIAAQTSTVSITINSDTVLKFSSTDVVAANQSSFSFVVPVGQSYQVVNSGAGSQTLNSIYELLL